MMQTPEETYQQATEILTAMNREQEMSSPILELIVWAYGGEIPTQEHSQMQFQHLMNLSETEILHQIQRTGLPDLSPTQLEHLQGPPKQQQKVEAGLRRDLKLMLAGVQL